MGRGAPQRKVPMKTFFMKIFMVVAAALCLSEGLALIAVGLGRTSSEQFLSIYNRLMASPKVLSFVLGVGVFFLILGFILLVVSSRTKPAPKIIMVEKEGKSLGIPQQTIGDFIRQIMEQNPYASDVNVEFEPKAEGVEIMIASAFSGVPSLHQEIDRIEKVIKSEIENVFGWKGFNVHFQLRGVSVNPKRKYFSSNNGEKKATPQDNQEASMPAVEQEDESALTVKEKAGGRDTRAQGDEFEGEDEGRDELRPREKHKPKDKSMLSKMLWGK